MTTYHFNAIACKAITGIKLKQLQRKFNYVSLNTFFGETISLKDGSLADLLDLFDSDCETIESIQLTDFNESVEQINITNVNQFFTPVLKGNIMRTTNINKTAMALAWLLLKANRVMTSKAKGFAYFLTIAYKMLKNESHFIHVLKGLRNVSYKMFYDESVTVARYVTFNSFYLRLRSFASNNINKEVAY